MSNSLQHEFFTQLFRDNRDLAAILLKDKLGVKMPPYAYGRDVSEDLSALILKVAVKRADAVVVYFCSRRTDKPVFVVVVEVQRAKDEAKRYSWPIYHAVARDRYRCPTVLFVLCPNQAIAEWAREPIDMGQPNCEFIPISCTPQELEIEVRGIRQMPELAVLAAIGHADDENSAEYFEELARLLSGLALERRRLYADGVMDSLPGQAAKEEWRNVMTVAEPKYRSDFFNGLHDEGKSEGKIEAKAASILRVLATRKLMVSDEQKERITSCTDDLQLDLWLERAVTCESVDELFV